MHLSSPWSAPRGSREAALRACLSSFNTQTKLGESANETAYLIAPFAQQHLLHPHSIRRPFTKFAVFCNKCGQSRTAVYLFNQPPARCPSSRELDTRRKDSHNHAVLEEAHGSGSKPKSYTLVYKQPTEQKSQCLDRSLADQNIREGSAGVRSSILYPQIDVHKRSCHV